jgi:hypothetical protein
MIGLPRVAQVTLNIAYQQLHDALLESSMRNTGTSPKGWKQVNNPVNSLPLLSFRSERSSFSSRIPSLPPLDYISTELEDLAGRLKKKEKTMRRDTLRS